LFLDRSISSSSALIFTIVDAMTVDSAINSVSMLNCGFISCSKGKTMNPIIAMLKENNIGDEQINEIFQALTQNPLAAMVTISQLGLPQEELKLLMGQVMQNPALIKEAVNELGLDFEKVEEAKARLQN
jgi:hypothetical protein